MVNYYSANYVFPVNNPPIKNGIIGISESGEIESVLFPEEAKNFPKGAITYFDGAIVPGFINTHCHLELSHMKDSIPTGTKLVGFIQQIMKNRNAAEEFINSSMISADVSMFENGIVAVGDISNTIHSKKVKEISSIYYHTFVEASGFNPEKASQIFKNVSELAEQFKPLTASIVPHAPYSVSSNLLKLIDDNAKQNMDILSIHNQETNDENLFFQEKTGDFLNLYKEIGLDIDFFNSTDKTSLQTYLPKLKAPKLLLVHNTFSNEEDIDLAKTKKEEIYWCICPNANLYIEKKLPNIKLLSNKGCKITLGTDSLASNEALNILAEMQTIQQNTDLSFNEVLKWGTINGAQFLGLDKIFGSIEVGKKPGLNLIQLDQNFNILNRTVKRLI